MLRTRPSCRVRTGNFHVKEKFSLWSPYGIGQTIIYFSPVSSIFSRQRSFAEYWKYFLAPFNDVHAFGYNSTEGERIWMKFSELRVYCLELALADFGRDARRSESGRPCGNCFCQVNNSRLCRFSVSQISRTLQTRRGSVRW